MTQEQVLNNCFSDLQRAAVAHASNPGGKTAKIFLGHALKGLKKIPGKRKYYDELVVLGEKVGKAHGREEDLRIADKILTVGVILKRSVAG